jgi:hypothetical protein
MKRKADKKRLEVGAAILPLFFNNKMSTNDALSEQIDNAFCPAAGDATTCTIEFRRGSVTVSDDGVGVRDLNVLLTPGESGSRYDEDDIGSYGIGGKFGMFHFGKKVTVKTLREGQMFSHTVDFGLALKSGKWPYRFDASIWRPPVKNFRGTTIEITDLHRGRHRPTYASICDTLAHRYLLAIRAGRKIVVRWPGSKGMEERVLNPEDVVALFEQDVKEFHGEINGKRFTVVAGDTKNYNPGYNGLWIGYGFRFIARERNLNNRGLPSRFYGRVILGREWKTSLAPDKTDIIEDKDELLAKVYELLADWIELLRSQSEELRTEKINAKLSSLFENVIRLTGPGKTFVEDGLVGVGVHGPNPEPNPDPQPGPLDQKA